MKLDTDVVGIDKALLNMEQMKRRALDARPATRRVKEKLIEANRKTFESQGSSIGKPWAPLAEATLERKSREGIDPRPLHGKTGDLGASLSGGRGKRSGATKTSARAGSSVWYSVFTRGTRGSLHSHNTGEVARQASGISANDAEEVVDVVADWVVRGR
jgi:hypothetical protein